MQPLTWVKVYSVIKKSDVPYNTNFSFWESHKGEVWEVLKREGKSKDFKRIINFVAQTRIFRDKMFVLRNKLKEVRLNQLGITNRAENISEDSYLCNDEILDVAYNLLKCCVDLFKGNEGVYSYIQDLQKAGLDIKGTMMELYKGEDGEGELAQEVESWNW